MGNKKEQTKDTSITTALIGAGATIIVAIISVATIWLQRSPVFVATTPTASSGKIFSDNFNSNKDVGWDTEEYSYDNFHEIISVANETLHWTMESTSLPNSEYLSAISIPNITDRKDFCLIFDAQIKDYVGSPVIVVLARSMNFSESDSSHYYIGFEISDGTVWLNPTNGKTGQIGKFENGVTWDDKKKHTIKISLQDNNLSVYEVQTDTLLYQKILSESEMLSSSGKIRIGTELLGPNQKITAEFDNILVYDKCP